MAVSACKLIKMVFPTSCHYKLKYGSDLEKLSFPVAYNYDEIKHTCVLDEFP